MLTKAPHNTVKKLLRKKKSDATDDHTRDQKILLKKVFSVRRPIKMYLDNFIFLTEHCFALKTNL